ncbi:FGGY family carbohydrate kinase [Streptomyces sp. NPDC004752]
MSTILAIDQGTSKAIVADDADRTIAVVEEPLRPYYLSGGRVQQDPGRLLDSLLAAGRRAMASARRPLDAVAPAHQGEAVLAWDRRTGKPLTPAIGWQDRRAEQICAGLGAERDWAAHRTGLAPDPYFSAPKSTWLRRNVTKDAVVTTVDSWLLHQLTGAFVTVAATVSRALAALRTSLTTGDPA